MTNVRKVIGSGCLVVGAMASISLAQPSGVAAYEVTSIGVLGGHKSSLADCIDDFGRIVGNSREYNGQTHQVLWINGQLVTIPAPPGGEGEGNAQCISPTTGILAGTTLFDGRSRPAAWKIGIGSTILEPLPGGSTSCYITAVNDSGWIGGWCDSPNRSALWRQLESPIDLGSLGHQFGDEGASDINELGEIVGRSYNAQRIRRPYLWRDGVMIDIGGEPTDANAAAYGINNHTEVVGDALTRRTAFYWRDGEITDLPEPYPCGGGLRKARKINDAGLIVGQAADRNCAQLYAALWDRDDHFHPYILNDLIPRFPDITLIEGKDINQAGQIAAYGENENGDGRGYLVTPYQFEMSDPSPGVAGQANTIRVTGLQPGQRVVLVWGLKEGAQKIKNDCPGGTLLIRDPHALPAVHADANGVATFTMQVPLAARGRSIRLQAIAPEACQISHTVTWTFE